MIGIENIGVYIPKDCRDNFLKIYDGEPLDADFVKERVGFLATARKEPDEETSDMCKKAFLDLKGRVENLSEEDIECICVCSHNGDFQLPHTSAILQDKLALKGSCAAFDIMLACSGYVYSVNILRSFMEMNNFSTGILFTCDPYSKVLNPNDKSTDLVLGDAAAATLLSTKGIFSLGKSTFCTKGSGYSAIIKRKDSYLAMDNRRVLRFVLREVAPIIRECLEKNHITEKDIDLCLFHQASKYIVEQLGEKLSISPEKVLFEAQNYGNTISSSIPILLQKYLGDESVKTVLMSSFGAGMSAAATIMERKS